jgi:polyhydroxyalkanoate synthase
LSDFSDPCELCVFIDEIQIEYLEGEMKKKGYLGDSSMATIFNMLWADDLIWSFVVGSYLLGKDPFPFNLRYWNSDSTRMPAAMHIVYLRIMYQKNLLSKPGGITLDGVAINVGKVKTPSYIVSTREDHIAPWHTTYATTGLFGGLPTPPRATSPAW